MDLLLEGCDYAFLDSVYSTLNVPTFAQRDFIPRQIISLFLITLVGGMLVYFIFGTFAYVFLYDKSQFQDKRFLKDQVKLEIQYALGSMPLMTLLTVPWFLGEVRGHSRLYRNVEDYGKLYLILSVFSFLGFTDMGIYWIHRYLHHPILYSKIHKPHHKWIIPTPYASHAFHPLDGYLQSLPYHIYAFLFPLNSVLYICLFVFVNIWTVSIHDGTYVVKNPLVNSAAHHSVHHRDFFFNYGQFFTIWDRIGGSYRKPSQDIYDMVILKKEPEVKATGKANGFHRPEDSKKAA